MCILPKFDCDVEREHMLSEGGDPGTQTTATTLFGSLNDPPMALLSRRTEIGGTQNTIYIYLPNHQKEEKQDGS